MKLGNKKQLKEQIIRELYLVLLYTLFFTGLLLSLSLYTTLILGEYGISYFRYGYNFLVALILAKIIVIGQHFHLGERFANKPLIFATLYKTVIFTLFAFAFSILEHFLEGVIKRESIQKIYDSFMSSGIDSILAKALVLFFVFIPFFAVLETGRVIGMDKLISLFLRKRNH